MSKGIRLSEKHGVNPSIIKCPLCNGDVGIALMGKLKGDVEAPRECLTGDICDNCKKRLEDDKLRAFFAPCSGRSLQLPDKVSHPDYLEKLGKRYMLVTEDQFENLLNTLKENGYNIQ